MGKSTLRSGDKLDGKGLGLSTSPDQEELKQYALKLQDQLLQLQDSQTRMASRLHEYDTKYHAVLETMSGFRTNMTAQEGLMKEIIQQLAAAPVPHSCTLPTTTATAAATTATTASTSSAASTMTTLPTTSTAAVTVAPIDTSAPSETTTSCGHELIENKGQKLLDMYKTITQANNEQMERISGLLRLSSSTSSSQPPDRSVPSMAGAEPIVTSNNSSNTGAPPAAGGMDLKLTHPLKRKLEDPGWTIPPRVLLVDDDMIFRRLSTKFLQVAGCTIDVAADGIEAITKLGSGNYDIVLMVRTKKKHVVVTFSFYVLYRIS